MPDNLHKKYADSKLISLTEPYEVTYWCGVLNCTEPQLKAAVKAVGNSVEKVKKHFGK